MASTTFHNAEIPCKGVTHVLNLNCYLCTEPEPTLEDADVAFHQREYERLRVELQAAHDASQLRELPSDETRKALNDLLVRVRLKSK